MLLPGLNDERKEVDELCRFIEETRIDMIQWRNIALDPEYYLTSIKCVHTTTPHIPFTHSHCHRHRHHHDHR